VKNISDQKGFFSFCFEVFFTYRTNTKNQKNIVTEKEGGTQVYIKIPINID
jgi:hypothetical protein